MKRTCLASLLFFLAIAAGCTREGDGDKARSVPEDLTVEQLYEAMEKAIAPGTEDILHATFAAVGVTIDSGTPLAIPEEFANLNLKDYGDQIWLDAENETGRLETRTRMGGEDVDRVWRAILKTGTMFRVDDQGISGQSNASICKDGESFLLGLLMQCSRNVESVTLGLDRYDGEPAYVLAMRGESRSDGNKVYFEHKVFVDPTSYLPLAAASISSRDDPTLATYYYGTMLRYRIEFVERSSLPEDFFEPTSIEYVAKEPIPADNLQSEINGVRVYWIGEEFDAGLEGPLALENVSVDRRDSTTGAVANLSYGIEDDPGGYRGLSIRVYSSDDEEQFENELSLYWNGDDVTQEAISIEGGRAVLLHMATRYGDLYRAHLYFDTAIVVVQDYLGAPPYTGRDAFMKALSGVQPFE